jgi:hypothetical protein
MAIVDITEYKNLARDGNGHPIQTGEEPAEVNQQVAITAGSVQSAGFGTATRFVRVHTDAICRVAFGVNPTAAATSMRMAANSTEFFGVKPGQEIAVITST